jgi:hypothetical protein
VKTGMRLQAVATLTRYLQLEFNFFGFNTHRHKPI